MRATEFIVETAMMGKIADSGKIIRILKKAHTVPFSDEKNWLLVDTDPGKGNSGLGIKWIPADTRFEWVRPYKDSVDENLSPQTIHKLADHKGVKWDDEPSFLQLTKRLTGKEHLDDLDQAGLNKVKKHLDGLHGVAEDVAEGATVTRIDSKLVTDFLSGLKAYKHTDDWSQSGLETGDDSYWKNKNLKTNTTKGLFAGDPHRTALYATGNAHETRYVEFTQNGQPIPREMVAGKPDFQKMMQIALDPYAHPILRSQAEEMLKVIRGEKNTMPKMKDALDTMQIINKIYNI